MKECRTEGELRALLDAELRAGALASTKAHVEGCAACRQRLAQLEADSAWASTRLSGLAPASGEAPPAAGAWARLSEEIRNQPSWTQRMANMFGFTKQRRPALVALALVALVAFAFTLEPVRVAAGDFLSIFRVRQFAVVPVGPEHAERMEELGALLEQNFFLSEPIILAEPEPRTVSTSEEASQAVGFTVRTPGYVPQDFVPVPGIEVTGQAVGQFEVDLELARSLFEMMELDPALLPDSLGENPLKVTVPPTAIQVWKHEGHTSLTFIQGPGPMVEFPSDVDPEALGTAALQLLGVNEREARRMSEAIDWTSTLVLPIPTDVASFREVSIDGVTGLSISERYNPERGVHSALMWQNRGIVYFLEGNVSTETMMDVAYSIQ